MGFSPLRPLCLLGLHSPSKSDMRPAGTDHVTICSRCGRGLIKKRFSKTWLPMKEQATKGRKRR